MSARKQYEHQEKIIKEMRNELDTFKADFLLRLPIPMTYKTWCFLHKMKGDYE